MGSHQPVLQGLFTYCPKMEPQGLGSGILKASSFVALGCGYGIVHHNQMGLRLVRETEFNNYSVILMLKTNFSL